MKKLILLLLIPLVQIQAGFFQEKDKQYHIGVSAYFGAVGGLACRGDRAFNLRGLEAIMCGTALGMIPGIIKESIDQHNYNGWDNRDLGADAIGALLGAVGTVTIFRFNSGSW